MKHLFRCCILICLALCFFALPASAAEKKKPVRIVYVEWPCAVATTYIAKVVIEEKLGRPCEILPVSVAIKYQSLFVGEADATVCAWLPTTQKTYWNKVKGQVEDLGPIVGGARIGWVVPDYVPYTSMEELKGKAAEFDGKIYGIDPGAEYMFTSLKAIGEYGLDGFELVEGSDAVMVAMLADAIKRKKPVVVTGWAPHWKFGRWDLHFLEDPKGLFGQEEEIHTLVRKGLKEDMPDVYRFLDNFSYLDTKQLQSEMAKNEEKGADPLETARRFVREHPEQVEAWLK
ncbi:glycine betaine ABC transporter substrate-binding protein [Desulfovibrio sp. OttesenSCG-928-A18]|nr:glycine betaine ABC transporter substrate-binding protein [Desulfovibrio sp. OttesenSCG-928-A18]